VFAQRTPIPRFYQVHLHGDGEDSEWADSKARIIPFLRFCETLKLWVFERRLPTRFNVLNSHGKAASTARMTERTVLGLSRPHDRGPGEVPALRFRVSGSTQQIEREKAWSG
jgi:hypothetical protein